MNAKHHFMPRWLRELFHLVTPEEIVRDQLEEAQRHVLHHRASAEHHDALAKMYEARIARLDPTQESS